MSYSPLSSEIAMGRSIHAIHPSLSWTSWASANSDLWDHVLQTFMRFLDYCIYQMLDSFHLVETWGKMYSANRWVYWIGSVMCSFIFPLFAISSTKCFKWSILLFWWHVKDLKSSTLESKLFTCFCSDSFSTLSCAHIFSTVRRFSNQTFFLFSFLYYYLMLLIVIIYY